jgi:hypothetical protein
MLVFVAGYLWLLHKSFPGNWLLLALLYVVFIPVAWVYGWLTDPRPMPRAVPVGRELLRFW